MAEVFANSAASTLSAAITTTGATSCTVTSATGFPSSGNFRMLVDSEIMIVTAVAGSTFTITRGAEGTTAATHANGAAVTHVLTAGALAAMQSAGSQRGYFGDGADGAAAFDGSGTPAGSTKNSSTSYTLNRDVYYTNCTISPSVVVSANGWRVFVAGVLTLSGSIDCSGGAGQTGLDTGQRGGGSGVVGHSVGSGNTGGQIGNGGSTAIGGTGNGNSGGSVANGYGGAGGAGGADTSSHTGGAAGTLGIASANVRPGNAHEAIAGNVVALVGSSSTRVILNVQGGSGGGGGASTGSGTANAGGGGAGGGVAVVAAQTITGVGNITANGGPGGNATGGNGPGGGGGGGVVILVYGDKSGWAGAAQVDGGAAGTGGNGGASAGNAGTVFQIPG